MSIIVSKSSLDLCMIFALDISSAFKNLKLHDLKLEFKHIERGTITNEFMHSRINNHLHSAKHNIGCRQSLTRRTLCTVCSHNL